METNGSIVIVNNWYALIGMILVISAVAFWVWRGWLQFDRDFMTKRRRRKKHLRYVDETIFHLKYKIINLALSCERGDISLTAFNRRTLNAARLIRRYQTKLQHLNRLVK